MKKLIAKRPVLYLGRMYDAGDTLPANDQKMVTAWLNAKSAAWDGQEAGERHQEAQEDAGQADGSQDSRGQSGGQEAQENGQEAEMLEGHLDAEQLATMKKADLEKLAGQLFQVGLFHGGQLFGVQVSLQHFGLLAVLLGLLAPALAPAILGPVRLSCVLLGFLVAFPGLLTIPGRALGVQPCGDHLLVIGREGVACVIHPSQVQHGPFGDQLFHALRTPYVRSVAFSVPPVATVMSYTFPSSPFMARLLWTAGAPSGSPIFTSTVASLASAVAAA